MNRSRWIIVAALLVATLAGAWWWRSRTTVAAPRYRTVQVDRGVVEAVVSATGTIRPVVQVEVGSQVSGTVDKLHADYNSRVRAGQVICQLETSSFRARELQAEAAVARAEASVKDGQRGLARAQELFDQKYVSQADLDAAVVAVELRRADLKQARAQLEAAQVDLRHATIRAPIDGVVISRSIDLGQTVAASLQAPTLFVIANDLSRMQVETRIDEADIGQIRPGLPVSFTVDAFPDQEFEGEVAQVRLEPIVEQGVVSYTTVMHTSNPEMRLRPGMTANVTVKLERRADVLRVPNAALRFRPPMPAGGAPGAPAAGATAGGAGPARQGDAQAAPPRESGGSGGGGGARRMGRGGPEAAGRTGEPGGDLPGATRTGPSYRPGAIYLLRDGKPVKMSVLTGLTDGSFTEVRGEAFQPGDMVIVGTEFAARGANLQPPPGMGGPQFRGPGGRR